MSKFWFDTNFFLPANSDEESLTTLKVLLSKIRTKYPLYTTVRIKRELNSSKFRDQIRALFNIERVEDSDEFTTFCRENKCYLGYSKKLNEPADLSLVYAASKSREKSYIITNDEGFLSVKKKRRNLMRNVDILEPTDFLKDVLINSEFDDGFNKKIEELIISYAEHFIMYRLGAESGKRPIERILKSILSFSQNITSYSSETTIASNSAETILPEKYKTPLTKYIRNEHMSNAEQNLLTPALKFFKPIASYYKSYSISENGLIKNISGVNGDLDVKYFTNLLYLQIPELLEELSTSEQSDNNTILKYTPALQRILLKELLSIRIQQTVSFLKDCYFDEAFYHFRPIMESHWNIPISKERKGILKLLFGIFLLNLQDFHLFEYLLEEEFWDEYPRLTALFETLFSTVRQESTLEGIDISETLSKGDFNLIYHLGLYFANTGNILGLKIFGLFFQLDAEKLAEFEWHTELLERYLLELRINQEEITDQMKEKFLTFLDAQKLQDNTHTKLDSKNELEKFTPIDKAPYLYQQQFFLINHQRVDDGIEAYCWNDIIRSIMIIKFPPNLNVHLENVRTINIKEGKIKTNKIPLIDRNHKHARIVIEIHKNAKLEFKKFNIDFNVSGRDLI